MTMIFQATVEDLQSNLEDWQDVKEMETECGFQRERTLRTLASSG